MRRSSSSIADMHMHAANHEPTRHLLEVCGEHAVALFVGVLLVRPLGEGMGRGGDWGQAELAGDAADGGAELDDLVARLFIDLQTQVPTSICERRNSGLTWPPQRFFAFGEQLSRRFLGEIARILVDEEIFLLDADREAWFLGGHGGHGGTIGEARVAAPRRALGEAG